MPLERLIVKCVDGAVCAEIEREIRPQVGSSLTIFNYPTVSRYSVERIDAYPDLRLQGLGMPATVTVRQKAVMETSKRAARGIGLDPAADLITRLDNIHRLAKSYIYDRLHLHICHADFVTLCADSGLSTHLEAFDVMALRGTPMTVGQADAAWNASTHFDGYNDELCVLYVTLPGGTPFVMDPVFLDIGKRIVAGELDEAAAMSAILRHLPRVRHSASDAVLRAIGNAVSHACEGLWAPYDLAQELVKVTVPGMAAHTEWLWGEAGRVASA